MHSQKLPYGDDTVRDTQARKHQITINNPMDKSPPWTPERIRQVISKLKSVVYWCMAAEIGAEGTYHIHIFVLTSSPIRFSTLQKAFCGEAHIESCYGTPESNRNYVAKEGKWAATAKAETRVDGTFEEHGSIPANTRLSKNGLLQYVYSLVEAGMSNYEILQILPESMIYLEKMDQVRLLLKSEKYANEFRQMNVIYIFGPTGVGKTRYVMDKYGYTNVYRISDYSHPYDEYKGQDVVMFDEYASGLKIQDMLQWLDGYPVDLPARYHQKQACFTTCYVVSNLDPIEQYPSAQNEKPEVWRAFWRRFNKIIYFMNETTRKEFASISEYIDWSTRTQKDQFGFILEPV